MHGLTHSRNRLIQDLHGRHGVQRPEPGGDRLQTIVIPSQLAKEQFLSSPIRKHHHVPENTEQLLSQLPGIYSRLQGTVDFGQRLPDITINNAVKNLNQTASIRRPQQPMDVGIGNVFTAKRQKLLEQRLTVAHRPCRTSCQYGNRVIVDFHAFLQGDFPEPSLDILGSDGRKIEPLTTRQYRDWHFLRVCRAKNELHMLWRFFQRLQQRVERGYRQHVDFVDDIDLEASSAWPNVDVGTKMPDLLNPAVACPVDFHHIDVFTRCNAQTDVTLITGFRSGTFDTVQRLPKNSCGGCFPNSSGPGEKIGVPNTIGFDRIPQGQSNLSLANQFFKSGRTIPSCHHDIFLPRFTR